MYKEEFGQEPTHFTYDKGVRAEDKTLNFLNQHHKPILIQGTNEANFVVDPFIQVPDLKVGQHSLSLNDAIK